MPKPLTTAIPATHMPSPLRKLASLGTLRRTMPSPPANQAQPARARRREAVRASAASLISRPSVVEALMPKTETQDRQASWRLARILRVLLETVAEDRRDGPPAGNVVAPNREHLAVAEPDAAGDLVDDAVVDRIAAVVERDGAALVDLPGNGLVDVDEHGVDEAVGRGACDVCDVGRCAPLRQSLRVGVLNRPQLGRVEVVEHLARALGELGVGDGVRVARDARREQVRVGVHRAVDGGQRLDGGEDQRHVEPAEQRPQCLIDLTCVLAHPGFLALGALDLAAGRAVSDRRLADRARDVAREVRDGDLRRFELGCDLEQADASLRERQHERGVRERERAQERLEMEAVGDLDHARQVVRQAVGRASRRREEEREAPCLVAPELIVVDQVGDLLLDRGDVLPIGACLLELADGLAGQVLQLDSLCVTAGGRAGRHVDRDARRLAGSEQTVQLRTCRDVGWEDHCGSPGSVDRDPSGRPGSIVCSDLVTDTIEIHTRRTTRGVRMNDKANWQVAHLGDIERRGTDIPVREHLGIQAFGINAYEAGEDGTLIGEHDEGGTGQQELYIVLDGKATFEIDGETVEAPAGTFVSVGPESKRKATGEGTVLAIGATPGQAYEGVDWGEAWPLHSESMIAYNEERYADALAAVRKALEHMPDHAGLNYNYACFATRAGETGDDTFAHLRRAVELLPRFRQDARSDPDFAAVRDDPRFEEALR